jgi:flavodoxin
MAAPSVFAGDKRVLICWFSRSGLTKRVVDILQPLIHADLFEIKVDSNYGGISGYLRAGWHYMRSIQPGLASQAPDFASYDVYVVASPVWAWTIPAPISSFLDASDFGGKPVIALETSGGQPGSYLDAFQAKLKNGTLIRKGGFARVEKETDESLAAKVRAWLDGL